MTEIEFEQEIPQIHLEDQDKLIDYAFGYHQRVLNSSFFPIVVACNKDAIFVYNDDVADDFEKGKYVFNIKETFPIKDIKYIIHETYKKHRNYKEYGRICIVFDDEGRSDYEFYYKMRDKAEMKHFLKSLKKTEAIIRHRRTKKYYLYR